MQVAQLAHISVYTIPPNISSINNIIIVMDYFDYVLYSVEAGYVNHTPVFTFNHVFPTTVYPCLRLFLQFSHYFLNLCF